MVIMHIISLSLALRFLRLGFEIQAHHINTHLYILYIECSFDVHFTLYRKVVLFTSYMNYTSPSTQFTFDVNTNTVFKKDDQNFINILGIQQLNSLENVSLLDYSLSANNVIEPHYHQNVTELVYCISGAATVFMINPFTK